MHANTRTHSLAHTHVLTGGKQFAKYTNHAVKSQLGPSWAPGGGEVVSSKEAHPLRMDKAVCACPSFFPVTPKTQRPTPCVSVNQRCRRGLRTPSLARSCRLTFALKRSSLLITCPHTRNVCTRTAGQKKRNVCTCNNRHGHAPEKKGFITDGRGFKNFCGFEAWLLYNSFK